MKTLWVMLIMMVIILMPVMAMAQNYPAGEKAPLSQPLVREGTVAVSMVKALNLGTTTNEVEAENLLIAAGIAPHNGWISDYPVTPDIAGEIRATVNNASDSGSLKFGTGEAVRAFDGVMARHNLTFTYDNSGRIAGREEAPVYPDNSEMIDYYSSEGPPPVTYYAPPADYANMYSWVPYPFWGWNTWFPGFFVLSDFDRFHFDNDHVFAVSNHIFDERQHRFARIDADVRFREFHGRRFDEQGKYFVNHNLIGPSHFSRGVEKALVTEHNRSRSDFDRGNANFSGRREMRGEGSYMNRENRPHVSSSGKSFNFSPGREGPSVAPSGRERSFNRPSERTFGPSSREAFSSNRSFTPSFSGRTVSPSSGHRGFGMSFGGMSGGFSGGFGGGHGGGHGGRR